VKRKRFATEQIIKILKEAELGIKIAELCRKHGISEQTFYNWRESLLCYLLLGSHLFPPLVSWCFLVKNTLAKEETDCHYFYPLTVGKVVNFCR